MNNYINIMGNLIRDPQVKATPTGKVVCELGIANEQRITRKGGNITLVSYFDVEVWGSTAENCGKVLTKGSAIIVEGRLRQERWQRDGKTQSRVRIIANAVHCLTKKQKGAGEEASRPLGADIIGAEASS